MNDNKSKHYREVTAALCLILCISVILRVVAALYLGDRVIELPGVADQISYHNLALRVLSGHGFTFGEDWWPLTKGGAPTAHWSFLYTLYLVAIYTIFRSQPLAARLIQALVVGVLQPYLAYLLAGQVLRGVYRQDKAQRDPGPPVSNSLLSVVPLLAAGLTAVYGYFIYYAATLMTEPFYITGILGILYLSMLLAQDWQTVDGGFPAPVTRWLAVGLGLSLAATVLLRQLFLVFIPFLYLWLLLTGWRQRARRALARTVAISFSIVVLAIVPFTLYNSARFGHFVLLNTNSGYAFFWANHPIYGTHFESILPSQMGAYQDLIPPELRYLDEAALDQALLRRGLQFIIADPGRYLLLSLSRVESYFKFWPDPASGVLSNLTRVGSFGLFLPFMLYGLVRVIQAQIRSLTARRWVSDWPATRSFGLPSGVWDFLASPLALILLFALVYTAIHLLSWALIRYRLPIDAVLLIFAAYGLVDLWQRVSRAFSPDRFGASKEPSGP